MMTSFDRVFPHLKMLSYNLFRYMVFRNAAEGITVTAIIILIGMPGTREHNQ